MNKEELKKPIIESINLEYGWDSYNANPPEERPIKWALKFIDLFFEMVNEKDYKFKRGGPSVVGGIGINLFFVYKGIELGSFIEFYNKTSDICVLLEIVGSENEKDWNVKCYKNVGTEEQLKEIIFNIEKFKNTGKIN